MTSLGGASAQPGLGAQLEAQRGELSAKRIAAPRAHTEPGMERYKGESTDRGAHLLAPGLPGSGDQNGLSKPKGPQP